MTKLKSIPPKVIAAGLIIAVVVLGLVLMLSTRVSKTSPAAEVTATIELGDKKIVVNSNGLVQFSFPGSSVYQSWSPSQAYDLLKYLGVKGKLVITDMTLKDGYYIVIFVVNGEEHIVYIPIDDPIIDDLFDGGGGGDSGDGGGGGGGGFSFHATPTPPAQPGATGGGTSDGGNGGTGGGGSGTGWTIPEDCPLWLLSFCLYPAAPAPTIGPTINPNEVTPDCSYWNQFIKGDKAVVSNTLCIK